MSGVSTPRETVVSKTLSPALAQRTSAGGASLSITSCSQKQTRHANPDDSVQHKVLIVAGALLHDYLVNEEMERA